MSEVSPLVAMRSRVAAAKDHGPAHVARLLAALGPCAGAMKHAVAAEARPAVAAEAAAIAASCSAAADQAIVAVDAASGLKQANAAAAAWAVGGECVAAATATGTWAGDATAAAAAPLGVLSSVRSLLTVAGPAAAATKSSDASAAAFAGFAVSDASADAVAQAAERLAVTEAQLRMLMWAAHHSCTELVAGGADAAIDAYFASVGAAVDAGSVATNDTPPKGRPLALGENAAPPSLAVKVPHFAALSVLLDAAVASYVDTPLAPGAPLGVAGTVVSQLCRRSVTAARITQRWIFGLFTADALPDVAAPRGVALLRAVSRSVEVAAVVTSQFGFELPWRRFAVLAATRSAAERPVARNQLSDFLHLLGEMTFSDRLASTVGDTLSGLLPPDARELARTAGTAVMEDPSNPFRAPAEFASAVADYRGLLHSIGSTEATPAQRRQGGDSTESVNATTVRTLLLRHRRIDVSGSAAAGAPSRYVAPGARSDGNILENDVRLAAACYFVGTNDVPSLYRKSARLLVRGLPGSEAAGGATAETEGLWVDAAVECVTQLTRFEMGLPGPCGAVACGAARILRALTALVDEGVVRSAAVARFFAAERTVLPLLGALQMRSALERFAAMYCAKLEEARCDFVVQRDDESGDDMAAKLRLVYAEAQLVDFNRGVALALAEALQARATAVRNPGKPSASEIAGLVNVIATASAVEAATGGAHAGLAPHALLAAAFGGETQNGGEDDDNDDGEAVGAAGFEKRLGSLSTALERSVGTEHAVTAVALLRRMFVNTTAEELAAVRAGEQRGTQPLLTAIPSQRSVAFTKGRAVAVSATRVALDRAVRALQELEKP